MAKVGKQLMEQATTGKLKIVGEQNEQTNEILTPEALEFVLALHEKFDARRKELLEARQERQKRLDAGEKLDFLPETKHIREGDWVIAPLQMTCKIAVLKLQGQLIGRWLLMR